MNGSADSHDLEHTKFLNRIKKSLYYAKLPVINCLSFPIIEVNSGHTLERLDVGEASRISRNACVSPCALVLALLYIERLKNCNPEYLQQVAPSELFLVSLLVASKFLHDDGEEDEVCNGEWANSGQMSIARINKLEKEFLAAIDWAVAVQDEDFWEKLQQLEKNLAYREVQKRGWCSYTEARYLMNSAQLIAIARTFINVSSICLATYAAGLATLLGSSLVAHLIVQSCLPRTSLDTTKSANLQANLAPTDLASPSMDAQSQDIDNDVLPTFNSSTCGVIARDSCTAAGTDVTSSQWWLHSVTWLPDYRDALGNDHAEITNCANRLLASDANYSFSSLQPRIGTTEETGTPQDYATQEYHRNVDWDEILEMISALLTEGLRTEQLYYENLHRPTELRIYY
ncbi:protein CNPPD1 isoform X2 [Ooceraea biroi]|uniref:protein CNPPD1 isoform X2 n=1 Tax=Ooceraea biroi TaxID=2015173 RepID=UPI0005B7BB48|nr:protein CNPPD1 isoform X2 [Ooceraea biroi]